MWKLHAQPNKSATFTYMEPLLFAEISLNNVFE